LFTGLRAQTIAASGLFEKLFASLETTVRQPLSQIVIEYPNRFSKPVRYELQAACFFDKVNSLYFLKNAIINFELFFIPNRF